MISELVVVALPIGNTEDLSFRARKFLERANGILAEDTRKFKEFMRYAGLNLQTPIVSLPSFTEKSLDYSDFFKKLEGKSWALVSDAGTPAVSDPGSWIIRAANLQGIKVSALPGPSALTLALQITGGFGLPVSFLGFPPKKQKKEFFETCAASRTLVFFESKHQILNTLEILSEGIYQNSKVFVLRELTKDHEEIIQGTAAELAKVFAERIGKNDPLGELTLVLESQGVGNSKEFKMSPQDLVTFKNSKPSEAAKFLSKMTGITRESAYTLLQNKDG